MLKVDNGKTILFLAKREYTGNRNRNLLVVLAIVLTTFLITTIWCLGGSYYKMLERRNVTMEGILYDVSLPIPTEEQVKKAQEMPGIVHAGLSVKCAVIEDFKGELMRVRLFWADEICWNEQYVPAFEFLEGTYPQKENEIVLSTKSLSDMGIENPEIGMKLPVTLGTLGKNAKLHDYQMTFILSGYYREYARQTNGFVSEAFYKKTGAQQTDFTQGYLYMSLENTLYSPKDIEKLGTELKLQENQMIYADTMLLWKFIRTMGVFAFLLLMICASGYLFIYNVLYISLVRNVQFYGQLKIIGTTDPQIRTFVWWQIAWNLLIGIPIGLLMGTALSTVIVPGLLKSISTYSDGSQQMVFHPLILLGAALFSIITVCTGSHKPIKIVGDMTPIEALRYVGMKGSMKKARGRNNGKLFYMARRNVFRDKKQVIIVILSLFLAMELFLCINAYTKQQSAKEVLNRGYSYDMRVSNGKYLEKPGQQQFTEEQLQKLNATEGIKEIRTAYAADIVFQQREPLLEPYFQEVWGGPLYGEKEYEGHMEKWEKDADYKFAQGVLVGIDEAEFDYLNTQLEKAIDKEAFQRGEIAIIDGRMASEQTAKLVGKDLTFYINGSACTIQIAEKGSWYSSVYGAAGGYGPEIIVSENLLSEYVEEPLLQTVSIVYDISFNKEMDNQVREIFSDTSVFIQEAKMDDYEELYQTEMQMRILGTSLCAILIFLAILNFGNLMACGIENRKKEFEILSSIGMTRKQIWLMLAMEGEWYVVFSILLVIVIGIPIAYVMNDLINIADIALELPIVSNLAIISVFLLLCAGIPIALFQRLMKGERK